MTQPATIPDVGRWSNENPHVQSILAFIRRKRNVTAPMLIEWDNAHGRHLFTWDDALAAEAYRIHEARMFLNTFRMIRDGLNVRAFINIPGSEGEEEIEDRDRLYHHAEDIAEDASLRAACIADLKKRMTRIGMQLRFWKLEYEEQQQFFVALKKEIFGTKGGSHV
jgi:hypothetical protein